MDIKNAKTMAFTMRTLLIVSALLNVVIAQNAPVTIQYTMQEEYEPLTFVGDISSTLRTGLLANLSVSQRAGLSFRILNDDNDGNYFNIESDTGVLRTTQRKIDREEICPLETDCSILLNIAISAGQFFQEVNVQIRIEDLNDNRPMFLNNVNGVITRSLPENTQVGTSISIPTADDLDSPRYSIARYQLLTPSSEFRLQVSPDLQSLHLVLQKELDREQESSYRLVVAAYDGGQPPRTGSLTIDVQVLDVNDNQPQFNNQSYSVTVPENQDVNSIVLTVKAVDLDLGPDGPLIYGFTSRTNLNFGRTFSINNTTGAIYLRQPLDYEKTHVFDLVVTAAENAQSNPVEAKVTIHVSDINDSPPQITVNALNANDKNQVQISELESVGTYIAHIKVSDPDSGASGEFSCNLQQSTEVFEVRELYKGAYTLATAAVLDRETNPEYTLKFICSDKGIPQLTSSVEIPVTILDENDNKPEFRLKTYSVTLNENNYPGRFLTQVEAFDADEGQNGEIEYVLPPQTQHYLRLDAASGNITARLAFDHEQDEDLSLPILAVDKGENPQTAIAQIQIIITDLNDEAPKFTLDKYTFQINENEAIGHEVGQVSASDPDSDPYNIFTYTISADTDEVTRSTFAIEPETGKIYTRTWLDREQVTDFVLIIKATDSKDSSLFTTSTVSIYISDINDNFPEILFPNPANSSVILDSDVFRSRFVASIQAQDLDSGSNGRLRYTIMAGNEQELFKLDENSGVLTLDPAIESIPAQVYRLVVSVSDHGEPPKTSDANLDIIVNAALVSHGPGEMIIGSNLAIVIGVAVFAGILTLVLVTAIVVMVRRQRQKRPEELYKAEDQDEVGDQGEQKKRKEVSFSQEIQITDEMGGQNQYHQQKPTYTSGPVDRKAPPPRSPAKKQCNLHPDMQIQHPAAKQNNYLLMPVASKDTDSAHSEESTNTDSGRGSDTNEHIEHRGATSRPHRQLDTVRETHRQHSASGSRSSATPSPSHYSQQHGGGPPLPLPPRAPTTSSPYRPPRQTNRQQQQQQRQPERHLYSQQQPPQQHHQQPQPQYSRATSWNSADNSQQLDDDVFTIAPSHV